MVERVKPLTKVCTVELKGGLKATWGSFLCDRYKAACAHANRSKKGLTQALSESSESEVQDSSFPSTDRQSCLQKKSSGKDFTMVLKQK